MGFTFCDFENMENLISSLIEFMNFTRDQRVGPIL